MSKVRSQPRQYSVRYHEKLTVPPLIVPGPYIGEAVSSLMISPVFPYDFTSWTSLLSIESRDLLAPALARTYVRASVGLKRLLTGG